LIPKSVTLDDLQRLSCTLFIVVLYGAFVQDLKCKNEILIREAKASIQETEQDMEKQIYKLVVLETCCTQ